VPWLPSNSQGAENTSDAALPVAFLRLDSESRNVFVNRAAEQLLGKSGTELLGKVLWEVFPRLVGTLFEEHCRRAMAERLAVAFRCILEPWHQRWYVILAVPICRFRSM